MKTLYEFAKEMEKKSAALSALGLTSAAVAAGGLGGAAQSLISSPAESMHEEVQAETLKMKLYNILEERAKRERIRKMEEVVSGARRAVRI